MTDKPEWTEPTLFDAPTLPEARAAGREGAALAAEKAGQQWCDYALDFIRAYLVEHKTMHVDELWEAGLAKSESDRALGAVMQQARRKGWIRHLKTEVGVVARPSVRSKGALKPVWSSMIHR